MLEVSNLEVVYNDVILVLRGLSLVVPDGQIVALLGANGAGKTTTLRAISGLLDVHDGEITKGTVTFDGKRLSGLQAPDIVRLGVKQVMEGRRVFGDLTVEENLIAGGYVSRDRQALRIAHQKVFDLFPRLADRRTQRAGYLSGGEQQMLAIGRAMMTDPKLLILDEPSLGLAPLLVQQIRGIILDINKAGTSVLLIEQNATMALSIADFGYVMETGKVVMDGPAEKLLHDEVVKEFYLGLHGDSDAGANGDVDGDGQTGRKSFRDVKHYKRRKRWLS